MEGTNERHPLLDWRPTWIGGWEHWLEEWQKATLAETKLSLLHFGPEVSHGNEWANFYLTVADGHNDIYDLQNRDDPAVTYEYGCHLKEGELRSVGEIRRVVAGKAFGILCDKLFKNTKGDYSLPSWWQWTIGNTERVFWFFRTDHYGVHNLCSDRRGEIARQFLVDLVKIAWDRREWGSRRSNYERPESVKRPEIRIGLIRLMYSLGQLGLLLKDEQNWPTAEEEAEIGKLITHESFYVLRGDEGSGNPRDLEEASFAGSKAADVLLLLRVKRAEKRRLEERREARRKLENAKANLNRLG